MATVIKNEAVGKDFYLLRQVCVGRMLRCYSTKKEDSYELQDYCQRSGRNAVE